MTDNNVMLRSRATLKCHPVLCLLFPVKPDIVRAIAADMEAGGFDPAHPVVVWNGHGYIVDGYTRTEAAGLAGIDKVPVVLKDFADESEALEYAIKCQRNRRNLSPSEMLRCLAELDKRKQHGEGQERAADGTMQPKAPAGANGKSAAETAKLLGTSPRQVERLRTIADAAPEEVKAGLAAGDLSVRAAYDATIAARKAEAELEPEADTETHSPEWWDWCDRASQLDSIVKQLAAWEGQSAAVPSDYHNIMAALRQWQEQAANETEE